MHSLSFLFAEKKPAMAKFPLHVFQIDRFPRYSMHKEQNLPQIALRACISNKYWHESPRIQCILENENALQALLASPQKKPLANPSEKSA